MMCIFFFGLATPFLLDPLNTPPEQVENEDPSVLEQKRRISKTFSTGAPLTTMATEVLSFFI